jgi:lipopolysaccharide heptosyltransferase I
MNDKNPQPRNILIIKPSALGDVVLSLPALASLRASFPDARLTWLVRSEFALLLKGAKNLDDVLLFDRKLLGKWWCRPDAFKALIRFFRRLRCSRFDLVIDIQGLFRTALFAWITAAPKRIGMKTAREFATVFYTDRIAPPADSIHVIDCYRKMVRASGATKTVDDYDLCFGPEAASKAAELLAQNGADPDNYIVLIVGSAHRRKCWPVERFAALADALVSEYKAQIVAVGTKNEKEAVVELCRLCRNPVIDLSNRTDIPTLACLLEGAGLVVSNDTGPGHMAVAMNTPAVIIFGGTNPGRVRPYNKPHSVAAVEPDMRGNAIESRDPRHSIDSVSVDDVLALARYHLDNRNR